MVSRLSTPGPPLRFLKDGNPELSELPWTPGPDTTFQEYRRKRGKLKNIVGALE
jgi:hypothetical protein